MSSRYAVGRSTLLRLCHFCLIFAIFTGRCNLLEAHPHNALMPTLQKRTLDALDGDGFTVERRRRALDGLEGTDFGFRKRALDNLEGDDFGGLKKKRALDALEGDGFEMKRKRALDALEGSDFSLKKRAVKKERTVYIDTESSDRLQHAIAELNRQRYAALIERALDEELGRRHSKRALDALEGTSFGFRR